MAAGQRRLDIEEVGDVTIARFVDKKILDENNIQVIGNQLYGLIEEDARKRIILDFSNVEYLSSAALTRGHDEFLLEEKSHCVRPDPVDEIPGWPENRTVADHR